MTGPQQACRGIFGPPENVGFTYEFRVLASGFRARGGAEVGELRTEMVLPRERLHELCASISDRLLGLRAC